MQRTTSIALCLVCAAAPYESQGHDAAAGRRFVGVTRPSEELDIGSAQAGVIELMAVQVGDRVKKGQLLFRLTTRQEELEVARLAVIAESDAEVREAQARLVQAEREEKRYLDLHRREIAGDSELDARRREADVARIKLERAKVDHDVAVLRHKEAVANLEERVVKSPIDGYVAAQRHRRGEPVKELDPIVELVALDPMWVEFDCPLEDAALFPRGAKVSVEGSGPGTVGAVVVFASEVADPASQTFRVRLELSGRPDWKAGMKVFVSGAR